MSTKSSKMSIDNKRDIKGNVKNSEKNKKSEKIESNEKNCSICYTDLNNDNCVITPCKHAYCTSCFWKWLDKKETCAMCRRQLLNDDVVRERTENLQEMQRELMENYVLYRGLDQQIYKKEKVVNLLDARAVSLQGRIIRSNDMLNKIRRASAEEIEYTAKANKAFSKAKKANKRVKEYKEESEVIYTEAINEIAEAKVESNIAEEKTNDNSIDSIDFDEMTLNIQEMLDAERYILRAEWRARRRQNRRSRAIESAYDETEDEEDEEEPPPEPTLMMRGIGEVETEEAEEAAEEAAEAVSDEITEEDQEYLRQLLEAEEVAEQATAAEQEDTDTIEQSEEVALSEEDESTEDESTEDEDEEEEESTENEAPNSEDNTSSNSPSPRRILRVPRRNRTQSPLFVFGGPHSNQEPINFSFGPPEQEHSQPAIPNFITNPFNMPSIVTPPTPYPQGNAHIVFTSSSEDIN
jgi:hypothetical protein